MVNEVVLKYFRDNRAGHSMIDLKRVALAGGYSQAEVDEAVAVLGKEDVVPKIVEKKVVEAVAVGDVGGRVCGARWMKFAGILGFVFLGLGVLNFIWGLFGSRGGAVSSPVVTWVALGLIVVFLVLMFFYFYGFIKMGKATESKLLRVAAIMNIVSVILFFVLIVVAVGFVLVMVGSLVGGFSGAGAGATEDVGEFFGVSVGVLVLLMGFAVLFVLFALVTRVLFSIALIRIKEKIRFSFVAGILGLVVAVFSLVVLTYTILNPFSPSSFFVIASAPFGFWVLMNVVVSVLGLAMMAFESLALLDGSKKFEN